MSKDIKYNLPGYGFANCLVFGASEKYIDLFEEHGLLEKSKRISQLGVMKYVYPGAHHTRYEYIFTQLMLISNIAVAKGTVQRNVELPLGSELMELKAKSIFGFKVTGGDILQTLSLLSNLGHMYDTFAASKIMLKLLQESKEDSSEFYKIYKRNLPKEVHKKFDEMLNSSNYYKLHLYNMLHLLQGMTHKQQNKEMCLFASKLLTYLIDDSLIQNEATKRVFFLYKKIRKIAYLSVDMIYTPASFGVNLNRMIYTITSYVDDLFNEDSVINSTLAQLEDIIHKQIYDSSTCILNTTRIEHEYEQKYREAISTVKNIFDIRELIKEEKYGDLQSVRQPEILKNLVSNSELLLSGNVVNLEKLLSYDKSILKDLPSSRVLFGTQVSQNLRKIYSAFGLVSKKHICKDCQTIINKSIIYKMYDDHEKIDIVKYAIKSIYKYNEFFFNMSAPEGIELNECILIENGCKNISKKIRKYFTGDNVKDPDKLHEILSCAAVLEEISYAGSVICFVGGIKASEYNKTCKLDELDGFIYFPSRDKGKTFAIIIEAKNYNGGENDAEKQLRDTIPFLSGDLQHSIVPLKKCAYMELSLKE